MVDKNGNKMTDAYLLKYQSTEDGMELITRMYQDGSSAVHLSNHALAAKVEQDNLEFIMGTEAFSIRDRISLCTQMNAISMSMQNRINSYYTEAFISKIIKKF